MRDDTQILTGAVFDLSGTVDAAIEMSKPWWKHNPERHGIRISLTRNLRAGCFVEGHESHMFEVVVNLLKNAAEAIDRDGAISVRTYMTEDRVFLSVKDTGIGIPTGNLKKIFAPFWTTKHLRGAGMGLSGSLAVVRRHGGEISVQSREDHGTNVIVSLPRAEEVPEEEHVSGPGAIWTDLHIIVIDDMPAVAKMLAEGLDRSGAEVFTAQSGSEGLAILEAHRVDVIVCDAGHAGYEWLGGCQGCMRLL